LLFAEQSRAVVKEVVKEVSLCLYWTSRPHLPLTNHVNAELYGALRIVSKFGSRTVMRNEPQYGLCIPLDHIFGSSINGLLDGLVRKRKSKRKTMRERAKEKCDL
jgi:hypothetical protein